MNRTALALLAIALVHGLVHTLLFAPWMGEDEPWHLEYASYVADGELPGLGRGLELTPDDLAHHSYSQLLAKRRFPELPYDTIERTQEAILRSMEAQGFWRRVDWAPPNSAARSFDQIEPAYTATNQPQLYYVVLGTWLRVFGGDTPEGRLAAGRALSLILYLVTVGLAWLLGCAAFDDPRSRITVALVAMLLPVHGRHAAIVNNDVLATVFAALLLVLGARVLQQVELRPNAGRLRMLAIVVAASALAVLTKMTTAGVGILVGMVALVALVQGRSGKSRLQISVLASLAGLALVVGAVLFWNQQHNPALPRSIATYVERVDEGFSFASVYKLWGRFVGRLNWNSRSLPELTYGAVAIGFAIAATIATVQLFRPREHVRRSVVLLCLAVVVAQFALVFLRGVPEGRYLTPALPAIAVLVTAGTVARWKPAHQRFEFASVALLLLVP